MGLPLSFRLSRPEATPEPSIKLPGSVGATIALPSIGKPDRLQKLMIAAAGAGAILALLLVYPVLASAGFGRSSIQPAAIQSKVITSETADGPLTELEATMSAMSAELAGSRAELMRAEQVQTAVVFDSSGRGGLPIGDPVGFGRRLGTRRGGSHLSDAAGSFRTGG